MPNAASVVDTFSEYALPSLAWYAGIFDGEGCINFVRRPGPLGSSYHVTLSLGNTFGEAVKFFERRWKGSMSYYAENSHNRKRKFYIWTLSSVAARHALNEMLPHLVVKAEQARTVLSYYALPWRGKQGTQRTLEQIAIDKMYYEAVGALKNVTVSHSWEDQLVSQRRGLRRR